MLKLSYSFNILHNLKSCHCFLNVMCDIVCTLKCKRVREIVHWWFSWFSWVSLALSISLFLSHPPSLAPHLFHLPPSPISSMTVPWSFHSVTYESHFFSLHKLSSSPPALFYEIRSLALFKRIIDYFFSGVSLQTVISRSAGEQISVSSLSSLSSVSFTRSFSLIAERWLLSRRWAALLFLWWFRGCARRCGEADSVSGCRGAHQLNAVWKSSGWAWRRVAERPEERGRFVRQISPQPHACLPEGRVVPARQSVSTGACWAESLRASVVSTANRLLVPYLLPL